MNSILDIIELIIWNMFYQSTCYDRYKRTEFEKVLHTVSLENRRVNDHVAMHRIPHFYK